MAEEEEEDRAFLMEQDTVALLQQMRRYTHGRKTPSSFASSSPLHPTAEGGEIGGDGIASLPSMGGFGSAREESWSSSSSSRSSRETSIDPSGGNPSITEDNDAEDDGMRRWNDLAKEVPLRRPKIFLASRTHAQLDQMRQDVLHTPFAQHVIRYRHPSSMAASCHRLSVMHIASRAQLCINDTLKSHCHAVSSRPSLHAAANGSSSSSSCVLNEACMDAIRYESSREGRKARRERNAHEVEGVTVGGMGQFCASPVRGDSLVDIEESPSSSSSSLPCGRWSLHSASPARTRKMEEGQGCPYAIPSRLHALIRHLQASSEATDSSSSSSCASLAPSLEDLVAAGKAVGACPFLASRLLLRGADVVLLPYTYLLEEDQRQQLLGGWSTNPVTDAEEDALEMDLAARAARPRQPAGSAPDDPISPSSHGRTRKDSIVVPSTTVPHARPQERPPDCRGDLLLVDEAHHLTDQCLHTSAAEVTVDALQLVVALLHYYLARYDTRLLTPNKQRLREIIFFATRVEGYVRAHSLPDRGTTIASCATAFSSLASSLRTGKEDEEEWECSFHDFVFDAGVDHVDAHVLRAFLRDSHLRSKLMGLFRMVVEQQNKAVFRMQKEKREKALRALVTKAKPPSRKRTHGKEEEVGGEKERSPAPLASVGGSYTPHSLHDARQHLLRLVFELLSVPPDGSTNAAAHHDVPPSLAASSLVVDEERIVDPSSTQRGMASAWEQFDAFLKWFQYSGNDTTVLVSRGGRPATRPMAGAAGPHASPSASVIRLLQLEPGKYTLMPFLRDVRRTILAGGTMRPLSLTLYPLIPAAYRYSVANVQPADGSTRLSSSVVMGRGGWRIISEPHVVPPSSLHVWGLGVGPSGAPWNFSHLSLSASEKMASSSFTPSPSSSIVPFSALERRVLADLAAALLNFARVLPPEGMICFVPSYRFQSRLLHFLRVAHPEDLPVSSSPLPCAEEATVGSERGASRTTAPLTEPPESYERCIEKVKKIFSEVLLDDRADPQEEERVRPETRRKEDVCGPPLARAAAAAAAHPSGVVSFASSLERETTTRHARQGEGGFQKRSAEELLRAYKEWIENNTDVESTARTNGKTAEKHTRGALLIAVIGGKLSEGLNFADHLGRAVIVVGLPYANPTEKSTRSFLSHIAMASSSSPSSASLSSNLFHLYTDLCMRLVNQSVGRCIRHRNDYAVAILLDARYTADALRHPSRQSRLLQNGLSPWMQPSIHTARHFGECFRGVRQFFLERKQQ